MDVETAFYSSLLAFCLIRFVIQPQLANALKPDEVGKSPGPVVIAKLALVKILGTITCLLAIGAGMGMLLKAHVESLDNEFVDRELSTTSLNSVNVALDAVSLIKEFLACFDVSIAIVVIALGVLTLIYWSVTRAEKIDKRLNDEMSRLREDHAKGRLDELPPTEKMREVERHIEIAKKDKADAATINELCQLLQNLELIRRVNPMLLSGANIPNSMLSPLMRLIEVLVSRSLFSGLKRLGSVTSMAIIVLLIPASLGFVSPDIDESVEEVRIALNEAKIRISLRIELEDAERKLTELLINPELPDHPQVQISDDDRQIAAYFGRLLENLCTESHDLGERSDSSALDDLAACQSEHGINKVRREWTRRAVLNEAVHARRSGAVKVVQAVQNQDSRLERAILDIELSARVEERPSTFTGKKAERVALQLATENPSVFVKIRNVIRNHLADQSVTATAVRRDEFGRNRRVTEFEIPFKHGSDIEELKSNLLLEIAKFLGGITIENDLNSFTWSELVSTLENREIFESESVRTKIAESADKITDLKISRATIALLEGSEVQEMKEKVAEIVKRYRSDKHLSAVANIKLNKATESTGNWEVALQVRPEAHVVQSEVIEEFKRINNRPSNRGFASQTGSLSTYSSLFPGVEGQSARSFQASVLRSVDSNLAKGLFGNEPKVLKNLKSTTVLRSTSSKIQKRAVSRARSYQTLRGFAHVGGVLIGRDGNPLDTLDIRGFSYAFYPADRPEELWIGVTKADDNVIVLGPYNPAIAHLALVYAADGRPVTVTMVNSAPLINLKILLHPALVDTNLGNRAIELDRFVDSSTRDIFTRSRLQESISQVAELVGLYKIVWTIRYGVLSYEILKSGRTDIKRKKDKAIQRYVSRLKQLGEPSHISPYNFAPYYYGQIYLNSLVLGKREFYSKLVNFLLGRTSSEFLVNTIEKDPSLTLEMFKAEVKNTFAPLRERKGYFDKTLVDLMETCAFEYYETNGRIPFLNCVYHESTLHVPDILRNPYFLWMVPPPQIVPWSGVREMAFTLDSEIEFAKLPTSPKPRLFDSSTKLQWHRLLIFPLLTGSMMQVKKNLGN